MEESQYGGRYALGQQRALSQLHLIPIRKVSCGSESGICNL